MVASLLMPLRDLQLSLAFIETCDAVCQGYESLKGAWFNLQTPQVLSAWLEVQCVMLCMH